MLVAILLGALWLVGNLAEKVTDTEREFLGVSPDTRLTLPDLDLMFATLRDKRRAHPALADVNYKSLYQEGAPYYIDDLRARGVTSRRNNNVVQVITIVGSLAATGFSSLALSVDTLRWITPALTFVVGTASGLAAIFKFKDRSFYAQQTANAMEQEIDAHNLGIGRYRPLEPEEAQSILLEELHRLRKEQEAREQNLDQPSQRTAEGE